MAIDVAASPVTDADRRAVETERQMTDDECVPLRTVKVVLTTIRDGLLFSEFCHSVAPSTNEVTNAAK